MLVLQAVGGVVKAMDFNLTSLIPQITPEKIVTGVAPVVPLVGGFLVFWAVYRIVKKNINSAGKGKGMK